jgi:hypothetical protein
VQAVSAAAGVAVYPRDTFLLDWHMERGSLSWFNGFSLNWFNGVC